MCRIFTIVFFLHILARPPADFIRQKRPARRSETGLWRKAEITLTPVVTAEMHLGHLHGNGSPTNWATGVNGMKQKIEEPNKRFPCTTHDVFLSEEAKLKDLFPVSSCRHSVGLISSSTHSRTGGTLIYESAGGMTRGCSNPIASPCRKRL